MADNLKVFGTTYYDVQGQKFTDLDGNEKTYIRPAGTKQIVQNGTADVKKYEFAEVAVPASAVDEGTKQITQNGNGQDVVGYAAVDVNVPGIVPAGTKQINQNGTHDVTQYASAEVNVPNTYAASDEGKVVHNGALTAQTSDTVTTNDTYDTTLINSLTVNVSGGGEDLKGIIEGTSTSFTNSDITSVRANGFQNYSALQSITLTNATTIKANSFQQCSNLTDVHFPNLTTLNGSEQFKSCTKLEVIALPKLTSSMGYTFSSCSKLKTADLYSPSTLGTSTFASCTAFDTLILRKSDGIVGLGNVNTFSGTKFKSGGTGGTIYIPKAMYDHLGDNSSYDYKAATNWTTVNGYGTITWAKIEGSIYETQYADGTPIT